MIEEFTNAESKKAFLIVIVLLAFFLLVPLDWHGAGIDHPFHWEVSRGGCAEGWSYYACISYFPLYHWLAGFFSLKEELFKYFNLILFAVITPLLLFQITKRAIAVWFYFSTTSYFYFVNAGMYPQGLAMILLLGLFTTKNNLIRLGILILSIITHSTSFYLVTFAFLLILLRENFENIKIWAIPFCSPFWGKERPQVLDVQIGDPTVYKPAALTLNSLLSFFVKICPLPFMYWGIRGHLAKRRWDFLIIAIVSFVMAFFIGERALYTIPLMIIPGLVWYYEKSRHKKAILIFSFIWFVFLVEQWIAIATYIFC